MAWHVQHTKAATIWYTCVSDVASGVHDPKDSQTYAVSVEARPGSPGKLVFAHRVECPRCRRAGDLVVTQSTFLLRNKGDYLPGEKRRIRRIVGWLVPAWVTLFALAGWLLFSNPAPSSRLDAIGGVFAALLGGFFALGSWFGFAEARKAQRAIFEIVDEGSPGYGDETAFNAPCEVSMDMEHHDTSLPYSGTGDVQFDVLKGFCYSKHDEPCFDASSYETITQRPRVRLPMSMITPTPGTSIPPREQGKRHQLSAASRSAAQRDRIGNAESLAELIASARAHDIPDDWQAYACPYYKVAFPKSWSHKTGQQLIIVPDWRTDVVADSTLLHSPAFSLTVAAFPPDVAADPSFLSRQPQMACDLRENGIVEEQIDFEWEGRPAIAAVCRFDLGGAEWVQYVVYCQHGTTLYFWDASLLAVQVTPALTAELWRVLASLRTVAMVGRRPPTDLIGGGAEAQAGPVPESTEVNPELVLLPSVTDAHLHDGFGEYADGPTPGEGGEQMDACIPAWNAGNYDEVFRLLTIALAKGLEGPDRSAAHAMLGQIHLRRGELIEGVEALLRCLEIRDRASGETWQAAMRLYYVYDTIGRTAEAAGLLSVAKEANKRHGWMHTAEVENKVRQLAVAFTQRG